MSVPFSIVMICKNEAHNILNALKSVYGLSDDIVVYDSGSTDATVQIVNTQPARLIDGEWEGFGKTRQKAVDLAKYDWVLMVDADEKLSEGLRDELQQWQPAGETAYRIQLQNYIGQTHLKWGAWLNDKRVRLFNKKYWRWNEYIIHEKLLPTGKFQAATLQNPIRHTTAKSMEDYTKKMMQYACLTAELYYGQKKKQNWFRAYGGPAFTFVKNYVFLLGFLDGSAGFTLAKIISMYTYVKYKRLRRLYKSR